MAVSSYLNYLIATRDLDRTLARKAAEPVVAREVTRFTEAAEGIRSVDDLFDDFGTYSFAVKAYGLEDMGYARALVRKVVSEGASAGSYAARLSDSRFLAMAGAFHVVDGDIAPTVIQAEGPSVAQRYRDGLAEAGKRAVARIDDDVTAYLAATDAIKTYDDLVASDTALVFSLRAYGLEGLLGQLDAVRKTLHGGSGAITFRDSQQEWNFDRFRLAFGIRSGAVGYRETVVAQYRFEVPKTGERLAAGAEEKVAAFLGGLEAIKNVDALLKSWDVLSVGLQAFGLESYGGDKALLAAVLKGDDRALNRVPARDRAKFEEFRSVFSFDGKGDAVPGTLVRDVDETVRMYVRQQLEIDLGADDNNVRLALNFQREAKDVKTAFDILASEALAAVVRTALGISASTGAADIDVQARMINKALNIEDLQDPEKVEKLITRFLLLADVEAGGGGAAILSLFDSSGPADIGYDLLQARQSLLGRRAL